ncbi:MAG: hypothetical protein BMS9Abin24_226 [Thermodesulfobacteriota bacterium]|nr:MAG: hypothetical protein BMS9Abin24_226 [Thermodesulfobacteriota bacterium]
MDKDIKYLQELEIIASIFLALFLIVLALGGSILLL